MQNSGPQSPDILRCVEGLAIVYRHQGVLWRPIHLYQKVLEYLELMFELATSFPAHSTEPVHCLCVPGKDAEAESMAMQ